MPCVCGCNFECLENKQEMFAAYYKARRPVKNVLLKRSEEKPVRIAVFDDNKELLCILHIFFKRRSWQVHAFVKPLPLRQVLMTILPKFRLYAAQTFYCLHRWTVYKALFGS